MIKKTIALTLTLILAFSLLAVPVYADSDEYTAREGDAVISSLGSKDISSSEKVYSNGMVTVTVKVWKISGGKKVTGKLKVKVKQSLADDVKKIFKEIYNGKEKFPIYAIEGYAARSNPRSEHWKGTAIDINPTQNAMIWNGKVVAGSFWDPKKSIYSIKADGDVVKAFKKYGWYWGGKGWGSKKDYMHFSRHGT